MQKEIELAVKFLEDGQAFNVGDLRLEVNSVGYFTVTGWSQYLIFKNLTKQNSLQELGEIKTHFIQMMSQSKELRIFVQNKQVEFFLCFDDSGKASIEICSEKDGILKWKVDLV